MIHGWCIGACVGFWYEKSDGWLLSSLSTKKYHICRGRGAFESLGAGMEMRVGDIAFKSNFAVIDDETGVVLRRRVDRAFEEAGPVLCGALNGMRVEVEGSWYRVYCQYATEHRCGVVIREEGRDCDGGNILSSMKGVGNGGCWGLSDQIEGTDPLKDGLQLRTSVAWAVEGGSVGNKCDGPDESYVKEEVMRRERTARVVNAVSDRMRAVLRGHPLNKKREQEGKAAANVVLLRGCGSLLDLETFQEKHGVKACMVAPTKIIAGLGKSVGMDVLEVDGATGDYRSDFRSKAVRMSRALVGGGGCGGFGEIPYADGCRGDPETRTLSLSRSQSSYGFGFLHIKAVDDASHDRDVSLKVACLEVVDAMLGQLVKALHKAGAGNVVLGITGDHSTPVEYGDHSHEPVPIMMSTVNDIVGAIPDEALDAIDMDALPLPEDILNMSPEERIDTYFPWKRTLLDENVHRQNVDTKNRAHHACKHDDVMRFCETDCARGCLGRFPGCYTVPALYRFGALHQKFNTRYHD